MFEVITVFIYSKAHVGKITLWEFAHTQNNLFKLGGLLHVEQITSYFPSYAFDMQKCAKFKSVTQLYLRSPIPVMFLCLVQYNNNGL